MPKELTLTLSRREEGQAVDSTGTVSFASMKELVAVISINRPGGQREAYFSDLVY